MIDPVFWLGLSILLVAISLTALLTVAIPTFQQMGRAARSAEKLFDTLNRELPPTLEAIRLTGLEITDLKDDVTQGVQSAGQVVKQVDQSITEVKQQVQSVQTTTRSLFTGVKTAWRTLTQPNPRRSIPPRSDRRALPRTEEQYWNDAARNGTHPDQTLPPESEAYDWEDTSPDSPRSQPSTRRDRE